MPSGVSASTVFTLLGFCASVLFIVFVCSRLVCALLHRRRRSHRPGFPPVAGLATAYSFRQGQAAGGGGGLDPAAVAAFPTRAFSAAAGPRSSALCVICLAEYEDNDVLRLLPYCGHNFHVACIDIWLKQQSTCPVCRVSLCNNPDSKHAVPPLPSAVVAIPPCSPEASRSDPCHCLFVGTGYSPRTPEVLRNEPSQANQIQIVGHPSVDRGRRNNLTSSEVNSPGENNNQTVKLQMESPRVLGRS